MADELMFIKKSTVQATSDAIKEVKGTTDPINPKNWSTEIRGLSASGGDGDLVCYVTFMDEDGTEVLYDKPTIKGDDCVDVVAIGLMETPTKPSSNTENYTFYGYSLTPQSIADNKALKNVTEDRVIYVAFKSSVRYYTIKFYDTEADIGDTTKGVEGQITYGGDASDLYTPKRDGYVFLGWSEDITNVTRDMEVIAQWRVDDGIIHDDWSYVAENADAYKVGDRKEVTLSYSDGTTETMYFRIVDKNVTTLTDKTSKAKLTFMADNVLKNPTKLGSNANNEFHLMNIIKPLLNETTFNMFPDDLKNVIKECFPSNSMGFWSNPMKVFVASAKQLNGTTNGVGDIPIPNAQFKYFADGNSFVRTKLDGTAVDYWTSTCYSNSSKFYYYVTSAGVVTASKSPVNDSLYIAPCFCI